MSGRILFGGRKKLPRLTCIFIYPTRHSMPSAVKYVLLKMAGVYYGWVSTKMKD